MHNRKRFALLLVPCLLLGLALLPFAASGCKKGDSGGGKGSNGGKSGSALTIGYSDWPGWLVWEIANQKGFFKDAGVDVKLEWFDDYGKSIDAFAAKKLNALLVVCGDSLTTGAKGQPSTAIVLTDFSNGNDKIIGKKGIDSIKELKGKTVGLEVDLVEHILLDYALRKNGMTDADVTIKPVATPETPQALAAEKGVDAVGAWYPISGQALKQVAGSKALYTSADAPGLIYDALHVDRESLATRRDDWKKVVGVWFRCLDFLNDKKTHDEAVGIMAKRIKVAAADLAKNLEGTKLLDRDGNLKALEKRETLDSVYGSLKNANDFYLRRKVYPNSQNIDRYVDASLVQEVIAKK